jgi:hypothetical protein
MLGENTYVTVMLCSTLTLHLLTSASGLTGLTASKNSFAAFTGFIMSTTFEKTENHVAKSLTEHPDSTQAFSKELHGMQHGKSAQRFQHDLGKMNDDLHKQGLLPGLQIVDNGKDHDFGLKKMDGANNKGDTEKTAPTQGGDKHSVLEGAQKTLADPKASAADKLSTVENLSKNGIKNIQVADSDGKMRDYSIETKKSGNREMVHLYGKDDNGQSRIALRGVDNGDGTFVHEKDQQGRDASYQGSSWAEGAHGKSNVGLMSDVQNSAPRNSDSTPARSANDLTRSPDADTTPKKPAEAGDGTKADKTAQSADGPKPDKTAEPGSPERPLGSIDRSQFDSQLNNPTVKEAFAKRLAAEVGSQGPAAQTAFAEEVMNRAASRGKTIMQALSGRYYPIHDVEKLPKSDPRYIEAGLKAIDNAWHNGTNTINGATGNASSHVGFGVKGGHYDAQHHWVSPNQLAEINDERFGLELKDATNGWPERFEKLKKRA